MTALVTSHGADEALGAGNEMHSVLGPFVGWLENMLVDVQLPPAVRATHKQGA